MNVADAEPLALYLIKTWLGEDWTLKWTRKLRKGGSCYRYFKRIELSRKIVEINDEAGVRELVLHEIAHGRMPDGRFPSHGSRWKEVAKSIGCTGDAHPRIIWPRPAFSGVCITPGCRNLWTSYKSYGEKGRRWWCGPCAKEQKKPWRRSFQYQAR